MNTVKPLRKLIGLRKRQQDAIDAEVLEQIKRVQEAEQQAAAAQSDHAACAERELASVNQREQVTERRFAPLDLVIAELAFKACAALTQKAASTCAKAQATVATQAQALVVCRARAARNLQRLNDLKQRVEKVLRERDEREEDVDAEESEETAAARISKRRIAEREAEHV